MGFELADVREYIVPLFVADDPACLSPDQPIVVSRDRFLGTAFFISRNGVALTAGHCVPPSSSIPKGHAFLAVIWDGTRARAQHVQIATVLDDRDIGVLKIAHSPSKYLEISFSPVHMGEDIVTVGIPLHSVSGIDYEYRCLKGHVTRAAKTLELSCPAPRGMSGSPILMGSKVVGVMSWNARSESLEDQSEETTENFGPLTRVTKTVTMAVTNYGQAEPISSLGGSTLPFTEGVPFGAFLTKLNQDA
jgi:hypothetical protein